ncbi:hypothetical protein GOV03_01795 [Candidatus Woesearchaeota archaeon]|nr:hypothetical protein [Candidatus Woesearchaeota archaeon]
MSNEQEGLSLDEVLKLKDKIKITDWQETAGLYHTKCGEATVYLREDTVFSREETSDPQLMGHVSVDYNGLKLAEYTGDQDPRVNEWYLSVKEGIDAIHDKERKEALHGARETIKNFLKE